MTTITARSIRIAPLVMLGVVVLASACATLRPRPDAVLAAITTAARRAAAVDTVWPGYRPFERGFIIFIPGGDAWLVADEAPPAPWVAVASAEPRVAGRLYHRAGALPGLPGGIDTRYPVGEMTYPAVDFGGDAWETLVTLYHEAFHTYQATAFPAFVAEFVPPEAIAPTHVAAIELERRILASALNAAPGPPTDSLIAAFLAVRAERMAALSDSTRRVDRDLERKEGSAEFVGYRAAAIAVGIAPARVRAIVGIKLTEDLARYGGDPGSRYYRWRAYGTGAAMALLLEELGASWQEEIAGGIPFDSLLRRAARIPPSAELVSTARERFGHDDLLARAQRVAAPASGDPIADFLALEPHRLVIEMRGDSAFRPGMSYSVGRSGMAQPAPAVVLLRSASRASMTNPGFDITIRNRPLLVDGGGAPVYRLVVMLPDAPRLNGAAVTALTSPAPGVTYRITGRGTEIVVRPGALESIEVADNVVTVRIRAR